MNTIKRTLSHFFLHAEPGPGLLRMLALGGGLLGLLWIRQASFSANSMQNSVLIALLTVTTLTALHIRAPRRHWYGWIAQELGLYIVVLVGVEALFLLSSTLLPDIQREPGPGLTAMVALVLLLSGALEESAAAGLPLLPMLSYVVLVATACAFAITRIAAHILAFWGRLQRRHLVWSLTNSHLLLAVIGVVLVGLLTSFSLLSYTLNNPTEDMIFVEVINNFVPLGIVWGILLVMLITVVLPPAAVLAYFAARRTTRRLQTLKLGTEALRRGEYDVRVDVMGEDEVAALQTDFNSMAGDLEQAMHDLQTERDAVATLLKNRRELVASVSHELRTPVAILRGYLETMLANAPDLPDDVLDDLRLMDGETTNLQRLIDDLFALSRAEVGQLELRRAATDVAAVIARSVAAAAPLVWQQSRVEVVADVPSGLPLAFVDAGRLEQALLNLLRNGARHTPPGGIVAVTAEAEPDGIVIAVKDTGEGIQPDDLPRVFERFYRADSSRARDRDGAGLGLALVKELIEAMDGTVNVSSTPGAGSCFNLRLPLAPPDATPAHPSVPKLRLQREKLRLPD